MTCNQEGCIAPAVYLFTWPGREEAGICAVHVPKAQGIAAALGFSLTFRPIIDLAPKAATPEPPPQRNDHPAVWDLVRKDIEARDDFGLAKYGTRLQPHNGRDSLTDAYQEALDLVVYLRQTIFERDGR